MIFIVFLLFSVEERGLGTGSLGLEGVSNSSSMLL